MRVARLSMVVGCVLFAAGCGDPWGPTAADESEVEAGVLQSGREFACSGVRVPGDYETLQQAVDGMAPVGGTICLEPGIHAGDVRLERPDVGPALRITGASAETTALAGTFRYLSWSAEDGGLTLEGIDFQNGIHLFGRSPVTLRASRIRRTSAPDAQDVLGIERRHSWDHPAGTVLVDGCFVEAASNQRAVYASITTHHAPEESELPLVVIANSVVQGGTEGIQVAVSSTGPTPPYVAVVGNTVRYARVGIAASGPLILGSFNNAVTDNGETGMYVDVEPGIVQLAHGHNAFGANAANYLGFAPASTYVSGDPEWLPGDVPAPGPDSPLRTSGTWLTFDGAHHDYYFRPRVSGQVDIGAVQSTPGAVQSALGAERSVRLGDDPRPLLR